MNSVLNTNVLTLAIESHNILATNRIQRQANQHKNFISKPKPKRYDCKYKSYIISIEKRDLIINKQMTNHDLEIT